MVQISKLSAYHFSHYLQPAAKRCYSAGCRSPRCVTMTERSSSAQTVGRAADLLRLVASSHSRSLRLVDLAEMTGLEKSTAHRLLQRLVEERMLVRDRAQRGYRLGPLLYELGLRALPEKNIKEVAHPEIKRLAELSGDMAFLVVRSGFETVCLDRIAGYFHIQTMTSGVGDRHPLGIGAGGQAILAALSDDEIDLVLEAVRHPLRGYKLFSAETLKADVARCRELGYALDEGTAATGVSAVGMPIRAAGGAPVAAVFIATISSRMDGTHRANLGRRLAACVKAIETSLA